MEAVAKKIRFNRKLLPSVCAVALVSMSVLGVSAPEAEATHANPETDHGLGDM